MFAAIFSIVGIVWGLIESEESGGWSLIAVIVCLPILIGAMVVDAIVKLIFKRKPYHIWGIE